MSEILNNVGKDRKAYMKQYYEKNKDKILKKYKEKAEKEASSEDINNAIEWADFLVEQLSDKLMTTPVNTDEHDELLRAISAILDLKMVLSI